MRDPDPLNPRVGDRFYFVCPETHAHRCADVSEVGGADGVVLHVLRPPSSPHYSEGSTYVAKHAQYCPENTPGTFHAME